MSEQEELEAHNEQRRMDAEPRTEDEAMTTESAGDRDAVIAALCNGRGGFSDADAEDEQLADAAISALRARGVSREQMQNLDNAYFHLDEVRLAQAVDLSDAKEEIARLRAALEKIDEYDESYAVFAIRACKNIAREALNASKGTT